MGGTRVRFALCFLAVFVILALAQFWALDKMSFHGDESAYLTMSIRATNLALAGRWNDPQWHESNLLGAEAPPVTLFLLGIGLRLFGIKSGEWPFWLAPNPTVPPPTVLLIGRTIMSLIGYASLFAIYFLGKEIKDAKTGLIAAFLFGLEPLWLISSRRAMSEAPAILFSILAVLLLLRGMKKQQSRELILSGISLGLAIDSKYNAVFLGIIIVGFFCLWIGVNCRTSRREGSGKSVICVAKWFGSLILPAVTTTIVINPVLYPNPIIGVMDIVHFWMGPGGGSFFISSFVDTSIGIWMLAVFHVAVFPSLQVLTYLWPSYELPGYLAQSGTLTTATTGLLFAVGITVLCGSIVRGRKINIVGSTGFLLFWFGGEVILVAETTRIAFDRYFLPVLPPVVLIAALGLTWLNERLAAKGTGPARQLAIPLYLLSQMVALSAFYPELYQSAWKNPSNIPMFGTIQQSIGRPLGQIAILLLVAAVLSTFIALKWPLEDPHLTGLGRGRKLPPIQMHVSDECSFLPFLAGSCANDPNTFRRGQKI